MRGCLSSCVGLVRQMCLVVSLTGTALYGTANAQPEAAVWTSRDVHAPDSQHRFVQSEFTATATSATESTGVNDSIYRPQLPAASNSRNRRVRPIAGFDSDSRVDHASAGTGILQSSHETLSPVPQSTPAAQEIDPLENNAAQTQESGFYDRTRTDPLALDSTSDASSGGNLMQIVDALQWTVAVLALAVVATLIIKKYKHQAPGSGSSPDIRHLATIPIRNVFQAHLLEIQGQQFLVTTDRNGVKTVTPVSRWDDFETPVDSIQETSATHATGTLTS